MDTQSRLDLSVVYLSPPQPGDNPLPASSQDYCTAQENHLPSNKHLREGNEQLSCSKKQRMTQIKPRITQRLDLYSLSEGFGSHQKSQLNLLQKALRTRQKIVVIAGAGISVSAGIPDFRSSTGLFSTLQSKHKVKASGKQLFDASVYQTHSSTSSFHDMIRTLSKLVSDARPTAFHKMLATLANEGRLMRLYTQNVDGIDTSLPPLTTSVPLSMKGPWPRTIQLHGGLDKMVCSKCNRVSDFQASLFEGPLPPLCVACLETDKIRINHAGKRSHGIGRLRPRIVLYHEHNPDEEAIGTVVSADLRTRPDAVFVVGTSMKIPGVRRIVREMCGVVRSRRNGLAIWVNHEPPPVGKEFEDCFDLIVKGACDDVAYHAEMKRWDEDNVGTNSHTEGDLSKADRSKTSTEGFVVIQSPTKTRSDHSMIAPAPSQPKSSNPLSINMEARVPPSREFDTKKSPAKKTIIPVSMSGQRGKSSKAIHRATTVVLANSNRFLHAASPTSNDYGLVVTIRPHETTVSLILRDICEPDGSRTKMTSLKALYTAVNQKLTNLDVTPTSYSLSDLSRHIMDDDQLQQVFAFERQYTRLFRLFLDPIPGA